MKVSIILPIYNVEKYLSACLDSVCNQTHKDLEIILVNDFYLKFLNKKKFVSKSQNS